MPPFSSEAAPLTVPVNSQGDHPDTHLARGEDLIRPSARSTASEGSDCNRSRTARGCSHKADQEQVPHKTKMKRVPSLTTALLQKQGEALKFASKQVEGAADGDSEKPASNFKLLLIRPLLHLFDFVRHHIMITLSGETPHLDIQFSPLVALSCLLYLPVAYSFFHNGAHAMGSVMAAVTVTSLYSDSLDPNSKFWCRADRFLCTMGAVLGPLKAFVVAGSFSLKAQVVATCGGSLAFLAWSRQSSCQEEFAVRHTVWHVISAGALTWLAFAVPLGP